MATTVTGYPTVYSGKESPFFQKAIISSTLFDTKGIDAQTDVDYKYTLRGIDLTDAIATGKTCNWVGTGTLAVSEGTLEVQPFHAEIELCEKDFKSEWDFKGEVPQSIIDEAFDLLGKRINQKSEKDIIQSVVTPVVGFSYVTNTFDGVLKQLNGVAIEFGATGSTSALTRTNISNEMAKVEALQSEDMLGIPGEDKVLFVSHKAAMLYSQNLQTQGVNTTNSAYPLQYGTIEVRPTQMPTNTMVLIPRSSIHVISDVDLPSASISFLNMYNSTLERKVRIEVTYSLNVGVTNKAQAVLYGW